MMQKNKLALVKSPKNKGRVQRKGSKSRQKLKIAKAAPAEPALTPAEVSEAARFRALVAARAAQKFMVRRIMAELEAVDDLSSSAA
jgi:hypothetical protein